MTPIETYISSIENPVERTALENLRTIIWEILPEHTECISYGMPAFRVGKDCVAGFARFKNHLSFFPFSGSTLTHFETELDSLDFTYTKSGVHFTPEKQIPRELVRKIILKRLESL